MANAVNGQHQLVSLVLKSKGINGDTQECFQQLAVCATPSSQYFLMSYHVLITDILSLKHYDNAPILFVMFVNLFVT